MVRISLVTLCIRESNPNGFNGHIFAGYRGRRLGNMPDITIFLSRQKSAFVKTARTENGLFLLRFVEDDAGIPGVFQGGRNGISAKRTVFGVRVRLSYAYILLPSYRETKSRNRRYAIYPFISVYMPCGQQELSTDRLMEKVCCPVQDTALQSCARICGFKPHSERSTPQLSLFQIPAGFSTVRNRHHRIGIGIRSAYDTSHLLS